MLGVGEATSARTRTVLHAVLWSLVCRDETVWRSPAYRTVSFYHSVVESVQEPTMKFLLYLVYACSSTARSGKTYFV